MGVLCQYQSKHSYQNKYSDTHEGMDGIFHFQRGWDWRFYTNTLQEPVACHVLIFWNGLFFLLEKGYRGSYAPYYPP